MKSSLAQAPVHTESNTREPLLSGLIGEAKAAHSAFNSVESSVGQWLLDALSEAIDATSSQKAIAIAMGQDRSQTNNQLQGKGNLYLWRVGALKAEYKDTLCAFARNILRECGEREDPQEAAQKDAETIAKALVRLVARVR